MKRLTILSAAALCLLSAKAQLVDLDFANKNNVTETGYTPWAVATGTSGRITLTGGITLSVSNTQASTADCIQSNWWKDGVNRYSKLVSDGITPKVLLSDGNRIEPTGRVELQLSITGLSTGQHTLMAYHNNVDGWSPCVLPDVNVMVNGETVVTGIKQTQRAQTEGASATSFITFNVEEGQTVKIVYYTEPDASVSYSTTSFYINALEFDVNPYSAADPQPANRDYHANCDGGQALLSWNGADKAVSHKVAFGNDSLAVANSDSYVYEGTDAACMLAYDFRANEQYYWRVDEVTEDGTVYRGRVWTFRPRRLAFPGAEGYGRFAIGGRGGVVYHVTSLDDDAANPQPGTFRYGITRVKGPRTIVFDVSGVIDLKDRLTCSDPYVTIAGQTAPGRGIMLTGSPFGMASDGITRFIRARIGGGDDWDGRSPNPRTSDGLGMAGNDHSIMDHCSVGWTIDEAFSSRNAKNVTLQHTLISEALNRAGHKNYVNTKGPDTEHGYAATIGGDYGSYHHNLLAHNEGRNWSMSGGLDGAGAYAGHHDMFNNVVYNWGNRATDGGTHEGNFVNNYYKMGPATTKTILLQADLEGTGTGSQAYYVSGNIRENMDGSQTQDAQNNTYLYRTTNGQVVNWTVFVNEPFFESHATVETATAAYRHVLSDVGCTMPELDNHDQRMVSETLLRTTSARGSRSGKAGLIDKESDSEGFAGLNIYASNRPAAFDQDEDGLPDWFEHAIGTDATVANNNADRDDDGYTDLEEYLNWMALPHFMIKNGEPLTLDLDTYFAGYSLLNYVATTESDGASISGRSLSFVPTRGNGLYQVSATVTDGDTQLTRTFNICVMDQVPELESSDIYDLRIYDLRIPSGVYDLQGRRLSNAERSNARTRKGVYILGPDASHSAPRKVVR